MSFNDTEAGRNASGTGSNGNSGEQWREQLNATGNEVMDKAKELFAWGNARRIVIDRHGQTLVQFPLTVGVIAAILAPQLVALGLVAAILAGSSIKVDHHQEGM